MKLKNIFTFLFAIIYRIKFRTLEANILKLQRGKKNEKKKVNIIYIWFKMFS